MRAKIKIHLNKIYENAVIVKKVLDTYGVDITAVTKLHRADKQIVNELKKAGINKFGDSRIENLMKLDSIDCERWLIRLPAVSQAETVVRNSDVSLVSEYETALALDDAVRKAKEEYDYKTRIFRDGKKVETDKYNIIIMADIGDLREGYFEEKDLIENAKKINELENINIYGIGANLTCYGGVLPDEENLSRLVKLKEKTEEAIGRKLEVVSGGNSTSYTLFRESRPVEGITNLRIGDTILFGRDCTYRKHIDGMHKDAFILKAEIIELKEKPSIPVGNRGFSALNTKPEFKDRGIRKRAILSVGKQDIDMDIFPLDEKIKILGSSSDHLIVDVTDAEEEYMLGDNIEFYMYYTAVLRAFTSDYIDKEYINGE